MFGVVRCRKHHITHKLLTTEGQWGSEMCKIYQLPLRPGSSIPTYLQRNSQSQGLTASWLQLVLFHWSVIRPLIRCYSMRFIRMRLTYQMSIIHIIITKMIHLRGYVDRIYCNTSGAVYIIIVVGNQSSRIVDNNSLSNNITECGMLCR